MSKYTLAKAYASLKAGFVPAYAKGIPLDLTSLKAPAQLWWMYVQTTHNASVFILKSILGIRLIARNILVLEMMNLAQNPSSVEDLDNIFTTQNLASFSAVKNRISNLSVQVKN
jgi:hypothetical protein